MKPKQDYSSCLLLRNEQRWKSVIWCICQNINIFFRPFHNGSSCDTRLSVEEAKRAEEDEKSFCKRSIIPHLSIVLFRCRWTRAGAPPNDARRVFERTHNGFGGLFENELQFPPDVWWKSERRMWFNGWWWSDGAIRKKCSRLMNWAASEWMMQTANSCARRKSSVARLFC